jgi:site-specific recombinase XerD
VDPACDGRVCGQAADKRSSGWGVELGWLKERVKRGGQIQYTAMYRDLRGVERSAGTFSSRRAAERAWQRAESAQASGRIGDPRRGRQSVQRYIEEEWFPHHVVEATTREGYQYMINRYIVPHLGSMRMMDVLPSDVREWITALQSQGVKPPTINKAKVVLNAIFTTAFNDQIVYLHPGKGVKTPPIPKKKLQIVTAQEFDAIYSEIEDPTMRLLVETDIESGLRWGELSELRVKDLDFRAGTVTISRAVVQLKAADRPDGVSFVVKDYPKDKEWRRVKLAGHLLAKLADHIRAESLGADDLLFAMPTQDQPVRRSRPANLPDPRTLGQTAPSAKGRVYWHGTHTAYQYGPCRCQHCKDALAAYRAERRAAGKDAPRRRRLVATDEDRHISNDWFRNQVWNPAVERASLDFRITPHGMRHAHASWLLAGGADLQVVRERLGHGSIATTGRYLHTLPNAGEAALAALDKVRGSRETPPAGEQTPTPAAPSDAPVTRAEMRSMLAQLKNMYESLGDEQ